MKLADLATGSDWIVWIVFAIFAVLSIILFSGYNTASNEEKEKYDEKKLCRTMGIGMSIIAILALTMGLFEKLRKRNIEQKRNAQFLAYRELCIFVNKYF